MIILSANKIKKSYGSKMILDNFSINVKQGQRLGVIGSNGSGKSTLFNIISGNESADDGTLMLYKDISVGYLKQNDAMLKGQSVYETLKSLFDHIFAIESKLRNLEHKISKTSNNEQLSILGRQYDELLMDFQNQDGYSWKSHINGVLNGLGFNENHFNQPVETLSGGEQSRLKLAELLLLKPSLLLLDEPTNHLDFNGLGWLETFLQKYPGSVLIISHDRYFLDATCTYITEISNGKNKLYKGNFSTAMLEKIKDLKKQEKDYTIQQKNIARQQEIIKRYRQFNRQKSIRAAESRERSLSKMILIENPVNEKEIKFDFYPSTRSGKDVLTIQNISKTFENTPVFANISFELKRGDKLAIFGPNGTGKTTLLRCIIEQLNPDSGSIILGSNVSIGYYDQKQANLNPDNSVLNEVFYDFPQLTQTDIRNALALFLFTGEDVLKNIRNLSGGEKARISLVKLMLQQNNFLLLDEPTNHLDIASRQVLEEVLNTYTGTIIAVSHDRYFINSFATHVGYMDLNGLKILQGNYDDYMLHQQKTSTESTTSQKDWQNKTLIRKTRKQQLAMKNEQNLWKEKSHKFEKKIIEYEESIKNLEEKLADPNLYNNTAKSLKTVNDYELTKKNLKSLYKQWEKSLNMLEELQKNEI